MRRTASQLPQKTLALLCSALLLLLGCLLARPAHAEDLNRAKELFRQATAAAAQDDHRAAAELYELADRAAPRANAVFNAAQQWDAAHDTLRAADAFATAILRGGLDERVIAIAQQREAELRNSLEGSLGSIEVTGLPGLEVSVAHAEHRPLPVCVHVSPGATLVVVEYPNGSTAPHTLLVETGKTSKLVVSERAPELPRKTTSSPPPPNEPARSTWQRPLGFTTLATGAAAIGIGIGIGIQGHRLRDEWDGTGHDPERIQLHDRAIAYRTAADVLLFGGGALAGAGLLLVVLNPATHTAPAQGQLRLTPGQIDVAISF